MKRDTQKGKSWIIKVVNVILDLITLTNYTSTIYAWIIVTLWTKIKRDIQKRKKWSNKSIDYNTRFEDTYLLYKYNIGIDYHHIRNRNEKRHTK